jgi:hypothetical protein
MNPPFPHIQPPRAKALLPWALKNCPTCVRLTQNVQAEDSFSACPFLSSIAKSILLGPSMNADTCSKIDSDWSSFPRNKFYSLPKSCAAFVATC